MKIMLLLLAIVLALPSAATQELAPEQQQRYRALINELRCLVCQNQTIADSDAPLAADLREQVRTRIVAGESDADIRRYVTDRYGEFVLYKPQLSVRTALLWFGPLVLVLFALLAVLLYVKRSRKAASRRSDVDEAALRRLLDENR